MKRLYEETEELERELGRILSQKACALQPDQEQTARMQRRVHRKIEEEAMMKHWNMKRMILTAAAICVLGSMTAIAAGRVTHTIGGSSRNDEFTSYDQLDGVVKELGFEAKAPESFSNGYAFESGVPGHSRGVDDAGNVVKETGTLMVSYHKEGMPDISLHISGTAMYDEDTGTYDQTVQYGEITLKYTCDHYRFVPEGYEVSEEEQKQMDEGELYISYGASQVEDKECKALSWREEGIPYSFIAFDNEMTAEELFQMAREVIDTK